MYDYCECCDLERETDWYLVDENAECQLCKSCARSLTSEVNIEKIDA